MEILPYQLSRTKDLLTSRAGLVCTAQVMQAVGFSNLVNQHFPKPKSNRGFQPCVFVNAVMLMLHEGGQCLDDLRHIREDEALRLVLGLKEIPQSDSLRDWLRRLGQEGVRATRQVNKVLLKQALHTIKTVTLDINATLSASQNQSAQWTYKNCKGYMPMVGHIAETGQVVDTQFRAGNISPSTDNLDFIHQCEDALPEGVSLSGLRSDTAGYQTSI
ncbi:MAG: transposase, partial [Alphaproteobacteria bacterium]|nr:transposase [Alphaproteobacteria bacterium]